MGYWGTAISSNDSFQDIYTDFFDLYDDGLSVEEVSKKLIADNQDTIAESDDACDFWFALASAQWECKALDPEVYEKVKHIIESGQDIQVWEHRDAIRQDLTKRKSVLENFLKRISHPKEKPRSRKKKIFYKPDFNIGDCLIFNFENGKFGGAVVVDAVSENRLAGNTIRLTDIYSDVSPTRDDFLKANVIDKIPGNKFSNCFGFFSEETTKKFPTIENRFNKSFFKKVHEINISDFKKSPYQMYIGKSNMSRIFKEILDGTGKYNTVPFKKFFFYEIRNNTRKLWLLIFFLIVCTIASVLVNGI